MLPILDTYAEPHVRKSSKPCEFSVQQFLHACVAFREDLERMPVRFAHYAADFGEVLDWNVWMKEIAH